MGLPSALHRWSFVIPAGLLVACGGGSVMPETVVQPAAPAPAAAPQVGQPAEGSRATAVALFEAAAVHSFLTSQPIFYTDGRTAPSVETSGACIGGNGSKLVSLDGAAPPADTSLPTGSHVYAVTYSNCSVDGLVGIDMSGTSTVSYSTSNWSDVSWQVAASATRGVGSIAFYSSAMRDVTASGSGTWRTVGSNNGLTTVYAPNDGATLVSNLTTSIITFKGGSFMRSFVGGTPLVARTTFDNFAVAINGINYTMNGTVEIMYNYSGATAGSGEVRITSGVTLVARVFVEASGRLRSEELTALQPF